jgi:hypothetical protein
MSEWYENISIEQLDGKRVRVEYTDGTILEGVLSRSGNHMLHIRFNADEEYGITVFDELVKNNKLRIFNDNIESVSLLDDGMTRIDDINDVRHGDMFVGTDGNRYPIHTIGYDSVCRIQIMISATPVWVRNVYFAYALRPKPKLPTEDGLYGDTGDEKRLWRNNSDRHEWEMIREPSSGEYVFGCIYGDRDILNYLHGATLYPVEIKRVES